MRRIIFAVPVFLIAFVGCQLGLTPFSDSGSTDPSIVAPTDVVNDVRRASAVDYTTWVPVRVSVGVDDGSASTRGLADSTGVITVLDSSGELLMSASLSGAEPTESEFLVSTDEPRVTLVVDVPSYETREVVVDDPAAYELIGRTFAVVKDPVSKYTIDSDGDGIVDDYDAFPTDPTLAFSRSIPATNSLTIAFEDNYPDLGDGDYNDFVADYRIVELRDAKNQLVRVEGTATAVARGASYDHEFGIVVSFPGRSAHVDSTFHDPDGAIVGTSSFDAVDKARIVLFASTRDSFVRPDGAFMDNAVADAAPSRGFTTDFTVSWQLERLEPPVSVWSPYDPYLLIDNPNLPYRPDIHLIGQRPLDDTELPEDPGDFRDADGYPRALLVPFDWRWPAERVHIETAYPRFAAWRESDGTTDTDWYFDADLAKVVPRPM